MFCDLVGSTPLSARLSTRLDGRYTVTVGFVLFAIALWMFSFVTPDWGFGELLAPQVMRGLAISLCIVPTVGMALNGWIMDEDRMTTVDALQDIPIGHKVALKNMDTGDTVLKYGIDMGKVVAPIRAGEHAHVHNIKTKRL